LPAVERSKDRDAWPRRRLSAIERTSNVDMLSRSMTTTISGRAAAARRLRRRVVSASSQLLCRTNGCATFLRIAPDGQTARCPICEAERRLR
jgi:hypothetical protein